MFVPCSSAVVLEFNLVLHLLKCKTLLKQKSGSFFVLSFSEFS